MHSNNQDAFWFALSRSDIPLTKELTDELVKEYDRAWQSGTSHPSNFYLTQVLFKNDPENPRLKQLTVEALTEKLPVSPYVNFWELPERLEILKAIDPQSPVLMLFRERFQSMKNEIESKFGGARAQNPNVDEQYDRVRKALEI